VRNLRTDRESDAISSASIASNAAWTDVEVVGSIMAGDVNSGRDSFIPL
jgi:predicted ribosomally synthesized peptide with SipW-like signal peptide